MKQYILVVDELNMAMLGRLAPGIQFVEVYGVEGETKSFNFLVSPIPKTETPLPEPEQNTEPVNL